MEFLINDISYRAALSKQELEEIDGLKATSEKKGIFYKIDPGTTSGIVAKTNGNIMGFMTTDCFGGSEIESAAIVDNTTTWDEMAKELFVYANKKAAGKILFICDPSDVIVSNKLKSKGLTFSFSEYRMVFDETSFFPIPIHDVSLRPTTQADYPYILRLDKDAFNGGADDIIPTDIIYTQIILQDNHRVGKLRISETDGIYGIYGVVVESQLRGKGIGAQALTLLLNNLLVQGAQNIYLEVDSKNPSAFHLYKKLGFKVVSDFRYYPYTL